MKSTNRPLGVTIVACLYLLVGIVGFAAHGAELFARGRFTQEVVWIELTEAAAIVAGIFLLRRQNWARWLALAWMAFHVVLSAFHSVPELAIHCLFLAVIAWLLLRPDASQYFRASREA